MKSIAKNISKDQIKDTGMVVVLVFSLLSYFLGNDIYSLLAIILLVVDMIVPIVFAPIAIIWLGFSKILGNITSKIILTIIFFLIVFPVGMLRRFMGKDSLQLKQFKKSNDSVFIKRDYTYKTEDLDKPY